MTIQQCRIYYFQFVVLSQKRNTQCFIQIKQSLLSGQTFKRLSDKQSQINCFPWKFKFQGIPEQTHTVPHVVLSGVDMFPHIYEQLHYTCQLTEVLFMPGDICSKNKSIVLNIVSTVLSFLCRNSLATGKRRSAANISTRNCPTSNSSSRTSTSLRRLRSPPGASFLKEKMRKCLTWNRNAGFTHDTVSSKGIMCSCEYSPDLILTLFWEYIYFKKCLFPYKNKSKGVAWQKEMTASSRCPLSQDFLLAFMVTHKKYYYFLLNLTIYTL